MTTTQQAPKKTDVLITMLETYSGTETGDKLYILWSPKRQIMVKEVRTGPEQRLAARSRAYRKDRAAYRSEIRKSIKWGDKIMSSSELDLLELPPFHGNKTCRPA